MNDFEKKNLLEVGFTYASNDEVLEYITRGLEKKDLKYYIVTPNPELLVLAQNRENYKNILNNAKLALPDGIGVMLGARIMGTPLKERITGVDLVKNLSNHVSKRPITVSYLGGGPNVAEKTAECLKKLYPGLKVAWVSQEWSEDLLTKKTDILFVAFGSPKQEIWISENLQRLPVRVAIGVGGSFDFISGKVRRAPKALRDLGLEWLFRLIIQPWRIRRQLSLFKFIFLLFSEKIHRTFSKYY